MGYRKDLLATRAEIHPGLWAVIPPDGLVNNVIPYIKDCKVSIVASPKMGASFVQYVVEAGPEGRTTDLFGKLAHEESFLYIVEGQVLVTVDGTEYEMTAGGYAYAPAGVGIAFTNQGSYARILLYKQRYVPLEGYETQVVTGNVNEIEYVIYDEMENVFIKDLLPTDAGYDMNMHILSFLPGASHSIVETHVQEHGMYILEGEGMYLLDKTWMGIKKEDFVWFGPYCPQCSYGVGREAFTYIYSKDCNRDVEI